MRVNFILITILFVAFASCEPEPLPDLPEVITISCQDEADAAKQLIGNEIFNEDNPEEGFRGNIEIINSTGGCSAPITDLSLFENFKFWRGTLTIESNDITNLDFLANLEQVRNGLEIKNCANLTNINLPKMGTIAEYFVVDNNPNLTSISIGTDVDVDVYEEIIIDSCLVINNMELNTWARGASPIDFISFANITSNPNLTFLEALSELSMPSRQFILDMNGTTVNPSGENMDMDSLTMARETTINALQPGNDYSWLNKAKDRDRFETGNRTINSRDTSVIFPIIATNQMMTADTVKVDSINFFNIIGEIEIDEVCDFREVITKIPLQISSNTVGEITAEILETECPE